jgi:nicotinate phosphoribosyltransferase
MSALLTDLYQLSMLQAYMDEGMEQTAVFELFVRKLPPRRNFLIAAGLEQAVEFLETLHFTDREIAWIEQQGGFSKRLLDSLRTFRFTGDVHALPEGTVFFPNEPVVRVTAPLPQAQLVESRLLNLIHLQTLIASKAARSVLAAPGKQLVDFGMRRAHGAEAALLAARASYLAGFSGTATAQAGMDFGIPVFGTMAHSFIQSHANERAAFTAFAHARSHNVVLLIDTYDTEAAARKVVGLAPQLARLGIPIKGVRLDSGDLAVHAFAVREILDQGGLRDTTIFSSGNLDEDRIHALLSAGAPIDCFGIGTALDTSSDAPFLDAVYKLQEYAGIPRRKRSEGKATWPGCKQIFRNYGDDARLAFDTVALATESHSGERLLTPAMLGGKRITPAATLVDARQRVAAQLAKLPESLRLLEPAAVPYQVEISSALHDLAKSIDAAT